MTEPIEQNATKQKFTDFIYYNWQVVLIVGLCIGVFTLYQINVDTNEQLNKLQSLQTVARTIETLDAKLDAITQRDAVLYPQLEAKIADLEKARLQFNAAEAKLKPPKIGDIQNGTKNLNENEISRRFNALGIDTTVVK